MSEASQLVWLFGAPAVGAAVGAGGVHLLAPRSTAAVATGGAIGAALGIVIAIAAVKPKPSTAEKELPLPPQTEPDPSHPDEVPAGVVT